MATTLTYLNRAIDGLRDLGLVPEATEEAPIVALLDRISDLDETKVVAIARTLSQASLFNEVVREQISGMSLAERYEDITKSFDSIRDDAKSMVDQLEDGEIDTFEQIANVWMKVTRGDIPSRFEKIKSTYLEVASDSKDQIEREQTILNAYLDFRGALKEAEVLAFEVLEKAEASWSGAKVRFSAGDVRAGHGLVKIAASAVVGCVYRGPGGLLCGKERTACVAELRPACG